MVPPGTRRSQKKCLKKALLISSATRCVFPSLLFSHSWMLSCIEIILFPELHQELSLNSRSRHTPEDETYVGTRRGNHRGILSSIGVLAMWQASQISNKCRSSGTNDPQKSNFLPLLYIIVTLHSSACPVKLSQTERPQNNSIASQ